MSRADVWNPDHTGETRPILNSLPGWMGRYTENPVAESLTRYWEELLLGVLEELEDLPRQLDATTCDEEFIPLLSYINGFSGAYSILDYPIEVQRVMISRAHDFIWAKKGTEQVLTFILNLLAIPHTLIYGGFYIVGVSTIPHTFTDASFNAFLLVSIGVLRDGDEWREIENVVNLYTAAYTDVKICYDAFYIGISQVGDPVIDQPTISIQAGDYPNT